MAQVPKDAAHSKDAALAKDAGHAEEVVQSQPLRVPTPTENGFPPQLRMVGQISAIELGLDCMAQVSKDAAHPKDAALAKDAGHANGVVQSQPPRAPTPTENGRSDKCD
eukprot:gene6040-2651_t